MAQQSPLQKKTVERVMHTFKDGKLEQRDGEAVKNLKQAIAIALHEAGASNQEDAETNRRNLAHTKRDERASKTTRAQADDKGSLSAGRTRAELSAEAKRKDLPGRFKMTKAQLEHALSD